MNGAAPAPIGIPRDDPQREEEAKGETAVSGNPAGEKQGGGTKGGMWEQRASAVQSSKARRGDCYAASDYGSCNVPWPDMRHRVPKPDPQRHRHQSQTDRQRGSE